MNATALTSLPVSIFVTDPWEFGTECGTGPFTGTITHATKERLVIALSSPIDYHGKTLKTIVAQPRHVGVETQSITVKAMSSNLMLLPIVIHSASELLPSATRDGFAAIGTVEQLLRRS
jgi:hypothetical protein